MTHPMPLSFSRLSTFEQCPAQFDYLYVSKRVQSSMNEASEYGDRVHKTLEAYGRGTLDTGTLSLEGQQTLERWGPLVEKITSRNGEKLFEHQMAVNRKLEPVDWFAKDVWIRSIADVLVVDGDTAYCLDYKTGKVKENPTQLQLFAAMVFWHYPKVTKVKTSFIWLK
jgi:RecB family exonuclease